jgi:hypothetical protein
VEYIPGSELNVPDPGLYESEYLPLYLPPPVKLQSIVMYTLSLHAEDTRYTVSVVDPHWFQCRQRSSILGPCGSRSGLVI